MNEHEDTQLAFEVEPEQEVYTTKQDTYPKVGVKNWKLAPVNYSEKFNGSRASVLQFYSKCVAIQHASKLAVTFGPIYLYEVMAVVQVPQSKLAEVRSI